MGAAAQQRGDKAIRESLPGRPAEFQKMDLLNALPKYPDAGTAPHPIIFACDKPRNHWWALDPRLMWAGYGFGYGTLYEAVRRWNVSVVGYDAALMIYTTEPL